MNCLRLTLMIKFLRVFWNRDEGLSLFYQKLAAKMQNVSLDTTPLKLSQQINKRTSHNPDEIQKAKDFLKMFESSSNEPSIQQIKHSNRTHVQLLSKSY